MLGELAAGTLADLAAEPTLDLSFLGTPSAPGPALWRRTLGEGVWRLFTDLQISLHAAGATFGVLPASLTTTPALAGSAVFRTDTPARRLELLVLPAPDAGISVHLAVGPVIADNAVVMVKLLAVPSAQPLANTHITLRNAQRQLLMGLVTKADGTAVFEQLPRGRYFVQVRHDKHLWEIPLVIVAASPPA